MTKILLTVLLIILPILVNAKNKSIEQIFKENKVKLQKKEIINGIPNYTVELPFDPRIGSNSTKLKTQIGASNDCKSFVLLSELDELKIVVTATMKKDGCHLSESLESLKP